MHCEVATKYSSFVLQIKSFLMEGLEEKEIEAVDFK
jgi:hypothetical protein